MHVPHTRTFSVISRRTLHQVAPCGANPRVLKCVPSFKHWIQRVKPEYRKPRLWSLLDDNVLTHFTKIVKHYLAKNQIARINLHPYLPDLAPANFFLFTMLKMHFKGRLFEEVAAIQTSRTKCLRAIASEECQKAFKLFYNRANTVYPRRGTMLKTNLNELLCT